MGGRNRSYSTKQSIRLLALVIVALGFGLRLYNVAVESLWYDELLQLDIAQGPLSLLPWRLRGHSGVPLDYLVSRLWISLGRSDGWVRLPAVIFGTLTLPLAFRLGTRLLGVWAGLVFMALMSLSPFHIRYSQEVRPYALVVLGATLAVYAYWRLRSRGRWLDLFLLQIGVLIFVLSHIFTLTIFGVLVVFAFIDLLFRQDRKIALKVLVGLAATIVIPVVILLRLGWASPLFYSSREFGEALVEPEKFSVEAEQKPNQSSGPDVGWPFIRYEILTPLGANGRVISLILFNGLAGLGLIYLLWQKRYKLALWLGLWLLLPPAIIVAFLLFRGTFFASRYIIAVLPAYLLLVTVGLAAVLRWLNRVGGAWLGVGAAVILSGLLVTNIALRLDRYYHQKDKENWHLVADFVAQNAGPNDAIVAFRAEPTLNWYYPPAWKAPNYYVDLEDVKAEVASAERGWVILSLFSSGADQNIKAWLSDSEQNAVRLVLDPIIHVYYLGHNVPREQLLQEIRSFALPVDHALYASLARENRRNLPVARQYFQLAIEHAPDEEIKAEYRTALETLER